MVVLLCCRSHRDRFRIRGPRRRGRGRRRASGALVGGFLHTSDTVDATTTGTSDEPLVCNWCDAKSMLPRKQRLCRCPCPRDTGAIRLMILPSSSSSWDRCRRRRRSRRCSGHTTPPSSIGPVHAGHALLLTRQTGHPTRTPHFLLSTVRARLARPSALHHPRRFRARACSASAKRGRRAGKGRTGSTTTTTAAAAAVDSKVGACAETTTASSSSSSSPCRDRCRGRWRCSRVVIVGWIGSRSHKGTVESQSVTVATALFAAAAIASYFSEAALATRLLGWMAGGAEGRDELLHVEAFQSTQLG